MSSRLDIELTSQRPDGSWTWRKEGARQPKGDLDGSVLPAGVSVGDVLRAEVDVALDGIDVLSVLPPKAPREDRHETIAVVGSGRAEELVTTKLVGKGGRRGDRDDGPRRRKRRDGEGKGGGGRDRGDRGNRGERGDRGERSDRGPRGGGDRGGGDRGGRSEPPRLKRLRPARTHRNAVLEGLPPEQRPIAEQVLRGGVPAVRQAVDKQNEENRSRGEAEIHGDELVAMAERMVPALRSAEWRDRADAAWASVEVLDLRDLRSVVVAADSAARDDEARALAEQLREALGRRVEDEHRRWLDDLTQAVSDGRTVRALRLSSRPPKAGAPLPPELTETLIAQATENLSSDTSPDRWVTVLDALSFSPVRAAVTPPSLPENVTDDLKAAVAKSASRLPHIAAMFGIEASERRSRRPRRKPSGGGSGSPDKKRNKKSPEASKDGRPAGASAATGSSDASKTDGSTEQGAETGSADEAPGGSAESGPTGTSDDQPGPGPVETSVASTAGDGSPEVSGPVEAVETEQTSAGADEASPTDTPAAAAETAPATEHRESTGSSDQDSAGSEADVVPGAGTES